MAGGQNFLEIAGKIPDRRIDLGESDLHNTSLNGGELRAQPTEIAEVSGAEEMAVCAPQHGIDKAKLFNY